MTAPRTIGELIAVPPVQTVIRLDDGRRQPQTVTGSFVFTGEVAHAFTVLAEALLQEHGQGYFLQGDFGSGKSHFLAALAACLSQAPGSERLAAQHEPLQRLRDSGRRFLVADISLVNFRAGTALEQILIQAVEEALARAGHPAMLTPLAVFLEHLRDLLRDPKLAGAFAAGCGVPPADLPQWLEAHPRDAYTHGIRLLRELGLTMPEALVEDRHETMRRALAAVRQAGFAGLVLVIDELSEFFRSKPDARRLNEDARTLQFLGELAGSEPLWILAAVQESLERTGDIAQVTFRKIKDRFPVRFVLSTVHIRELIAGRLVQRRPGAEDAIRAIYDEYRRQFPGFQWSYEQFRGVYPVHPATLALLEGLGDLFSQHRGIVDFVHSRLAGDPARRIPGILDRPCGELLAPDSIYEHFAQRLMEFSHFNVYPRHVVPHLDEVIDTVLEDEADRALARRLVRILVLYEIHPAAETPNVRVLSELVACMLASQDPSLNVQFVSEAILDPVVAGSRFLVRKPGLERDRETATYRVLAEQDTGQTLKARVDHAMKGLVPDDSRLYSRVLAEMPDSMAWPGPALLETGVERSVTWHQTPRRALALFCAHGAESAAQARIHQALEAGQVDFAVAMTWEGVELAAEHTAVWRIGTLKDELPVLREYLATRLVAEELKPSNPADTPLIDPARDAVRRLAPAAAQAVLNAIYAGHFDEAGIRVDPAARQLRRFDRLLEAAAEHILDRRYPRFVQVAPRNMPPAPRLYQRLLDEWVKPGSISLHAAQQQRLGELIEALAVPLGLAELRSGSYVFSPDLQVHPLLTSLFTVLSPAAPTPLAVVMAHLKNGPFGLPQDTAAFLVVALASGGVIAIQSRGRSLPVEFLNLASVEGAETVSLGELVPEPDRDTLLQECAFLAPPGSAWTAFGLRQQREAWQGAVKFKEKTAALIDDVEARLRSVSEYSAFKALDLDDVRRTLEGLRDLVSEVKVSHTAREGLERFLRAWRRNKLSQKDLERLRNVQRFLSRDADQFVFVNHYMRHRALERAVVAVPELVPLRDTVLALLDHPELVMNGAEGTELASAFGRFRERYAQEYVARHAAFHKPAAGVDLPKASRRAVEVLRRLAAIESLDRPVGLTELFRGLDRPAAPACRQNVAELLLRAPACDCNFALDEVRSEVREGPDIPAAIEAGLAVYRGILRSPQVLEAAGARAYAVRDVDADAAARLRRFSETLGSVEPCSGAALLDVLDETTVAELGRALAGRVPVERRTLGSLAARLAGRRLRPEQVSAAVLEWLGPTRAATGLALGGEAGSDGAPADGALATWWEHLHPALFPNGGALSGDAATLQAVAAALEKQYPAASLRPRLQKLTSAELAGFAATERLHAQAVREAWLVLVERVLAGRGETLPDAAREGAQAGLGVGERLAGLREIPGLAVALFPDRLRVRLRAAAIALDLWGNERTRALAERTIRDASERGEDWLAVLPSVTPLPLDGGSVIVILDAVAPDVWLDVQQSRPGLFAGAGTAWMRLDARPDTVSGVSALFGLTGEPGETLAGHGAVWHRATGAESAALAQHLPPLGAGQSAVVHVAGLDRGAHAGNLRLIDMPAALGHWLERELPGLRDYSRKHQRRLILTTDHGVTFSRQGLTHGAGGVFEQAVFRCEWGA